MSSVATMEVADEVCASCGVKGGGDDNITLKSCNGCFLVKYCSVKCQRERWPQHKKACKKRAAELKDELLFKQPESTDKVTARSVSYLSHFPQSQAMKRRILFITAAVKWCVMAAFMPIY